MNGALCFKLYKYFFFIQRARVSPNNQSWDQTTCSSGTAMCSPSPVNRWTANMSRTLSSWRQNLPNVSTGTKTTKATRFCAAWNRCRAPGLLSFGTRNDGVSGLDATISADRVCWFTRVPRRLFCPHVPQVMRRLRWRSCLPTASIASS